MSVAIRKGLDISNNIISIFEELDFKPNKRVYIKPNLSGRSPVLPGENTSIEVMDALIEVLKNYDCEIIIGHGALLGADDHETTFEESINSAGFDKYFDMKGVKLINLDNLERVKVKIEEMTFHLPLDFLENEIDTYINLAKIKTHMEATVSFALKNQMGFPTKIDRVLMHKTDLEMTIAKLAQYIKPDISILEGFPAMEKNGPHHGVANNIQLIAGGTDIVELDTFIACILEFDTTKIRHIQNAINLNVGKHVSKKTIDENKQYKVANFKKAKKEYKFGPKLSAFPNYACSRCINAVNLSGKEFKMHPWKYREVLWNAFFSKIKNNVVFGKVIDMKYNDEERYICIGNCTKKFANENSLDLLDKCPPRIDETKEFIEKKISNK